ncbi:MAG: Uma2 family endonuclease, partial [Snowella sp.]
QWQEDNITPQVVFEVLSPGNTLAEMALKWQFYDHYGVEEYYLYDPDKNDLTGWQRQENKLTVIPDIDQWQSPLLGIRWQLTPETWQIFRTTGEPFFTFLELDQRYQLEKRRAEQESFRAEQESFRAEQESLRAEQEKSRADNEKERADTEKERADNAEAELSRLRELLAEKRIDLNE